MCANDDNALREGILSLFLERFDALLRRRRRRRLKRFWNVRRDFQFTTRKQKEEGKSQHTTFHGRLCARRRPLAPARVRSAPRSLGEPATRLVGGLALCPSHHGGGPVGGGGDAARHGKRDWTLSTRPGENSEQNHQRLGMVGE